MMSHRTLARLTAAAATVGWLLCSTTAAFAGTLEGRLVDGLTGTPIPDATVRVLGTFRQTTTDADGSWSFDLPEGEYELAFDKTLGDRHYHFRLVHQRVPQHKPAEATLATTHYLEQGVEPVERPRGAPIDRLDHPSDRDRGPVDLGDWSGDDSATRPAPHTIPDPAPRTIRVARYDDPENCSNSIVAIEEMQLDEYVRGVLPPEIGVFQNLDNISETYKAFGLAAKSYGLYFMLVYDSDNRRRTSSPKPPHNYSWYHIDDTPCNQRYSDKRLTITTQAIDTQAGRVLVKDGAPDTLDKYEYAASCGEHGTRPAYQQTIVDDTTPTTSCVGDWCGHTSCAGHEDHPDVSGSDSCLVRGICQWGSAEWAESGKDYQWMLGHYQPNLRVRQLWETGENQTVDLKGYVHSDPSDVMGSGIAEATVELADGEETTTDANGQYTFSEIDVSRGTVTVTASKAGFDSNQKMATLEAGRTNWVSIRLRRSGGDGAERGDTNTESTVDTGLTPVDDLDDEEPSDAAGRFGGLGPLVTSSGAGQSAGCGCSGTRDGAPSPLGLLFACVGLGALRCRRD